MIKRIHVTYAGLTITEENRETVQRVLGVHAQACPVARSLDGAIEITTAVDGL